MWAQLALEFPDMMSSLLAVGMESDLVLHWPIAHPHSISRDNGC